MNNSHTARERAHIARVKDMACAVCGAPGPSDAHHVKQGNAYTCVPLCKDCHQGSHNGIHGERAMWRVMKMDEVDALAETMRRLT